MNAYIWKEFDGDCVQNIITSFLLMDLKNRVSLIPPNYGELTCIANNFGGQNKNMYVVRFPMWLVEAKISPNLTLLLFVKSHAKNFANSMFNLLKITYHCQYNFIYDELNSFLSENKFVNVIKVPPSNFHDRLKWKDHHYRVPEKVNFNTRNVFCIFQLYQSSQPTIWTKQDDKESPVHKDILVPMSRNFKAKNLDPEERLISINIM